jgi:hypothetical protein
MNEVRGYFFPPKFPLIQIGPQPIILSLGLEVAVYYETRPQKPREQQLVQIPES